jgi:hypothetical protein
MILSSNGREETSRGPLLLRIKVTYNILKNKSWGNWPRQLGILTICIRFYCDIKPAYKTLLSWLVRTTLSTTLYKIDVCMKLFDMASRKFGEQGGTKMQSIVAAQGIRSVIASELGHSRLHKKKMMLIMVTLEINLVYLWSPPQCTQCRHILMWGSPTFYEWGGTNQASRLLWPSVAMVLGDISKCPSLLWPWVATGRLCHRIRCYFGSLTREPTMKLFNMASPKFGERGGTNMQSMEAANVLQYL